MTKLGSRAVPTSLQVVLPEKAVPRRTHSPDFYRGTVLEVDGVSLFSGNSSVLSISGVMLVDQATLPAIQKR